MINKTDSSMRIRFIDMSLNTVLEDAKIHKNIQIDSLFGFFFPEADIHTLSDTTTKGLTERVTVLLRLSRCLML